MNAVKKYEKLEDTIVFNDEITDAPINYEYLDDGTRVLKNIHYRKEKIKWDIEIIFML